MQCNVMQCNVMYACNVHIYIYIYINKYVCVVRLSRFSSPGQPKKVLFQTNQKQEQNSCFFSWGFHQCVIHTFFGVVFCSKFLRVQSLELSENPSERSFALNGVQYGNPEKLHSEGVPSCLFYCIMLFELVTSFTLCIHYIFYTILQLYAYMHLSLSLHIYIYTCIYVITFIRMHTKSRCMKYIHIYKNTSINTYIHTYINTEIQKYTKT